MFWTVWFVDWCMDSRYFLLRKIWFLKSLCMGVWKINDKHCSKARMWAVGVASHLHDSTSCGVFCRENNLLIFPCIYLLNCLVSLKKLNVCSKMPLFTSMYRIRRSDKFSIPPHKIVFVNTVNYSSIELFNQMPLSFKRIKHFKVIKN